MEDSFPYEFLFPFALVPKGSKILIYGAGQKGQAYFQQVEMTGYCHIVAMADKNFAHYPAAVIPILSPREIHKKPCDFILIAMRSKEAMQEAFTVLMEQSIMREKILCPTTCVGAPFFLSNGAHTDLDVGIGRPTYEISKQSIAFKTGGGYGDQIIAKKVLEVLLPMVPEAQVDIYDGARSVSILEFLYQDMPQIKNFLFNLGTRYRRNRERYAAAISIRPDGRVGVDYFQEPSPFPKEFQEILQRLRRVTGEAEDNPDVLAFDIVYRALYQGKNCYTVMSTDGILPITDRKVKIPQDAEAKHRFEQMHLGTYVTVNYGNGHSEDNASIAKCWHKEGFEHVIKLLHKAYPMLRIYQLGGATVEKLVGADDYFLGKSFAFVAEILRHAKFHLDIEGGLVHLATQLGTKCIVLFGQTSVEYFGYPENINLHVGNCQACNGLYPDSYRCARGLEKPECMYSITPDMVMDAAKNYLQGKI